MGFSPGALATLVQLDRRVLIPVPENWTLEDAATVPVVYGTVLYGLVKVSNIRALFFEFKTLCCCREVT